MSFLGGRKEEAKRLALDGAEDVWGRDSYRASPGVGNASKGREDAAVSLQKSKIVCGNAACSSGWTKPWKNRQRPIFEGQWGCGPRCVQALIRTAVRREAGDGVAGFDDAPHRHRVPLGLLMLAKGWITQPQLRRALEGQKAAGGRIGEWLQQDCGIDSGTVTRGLSMQWNCPVLTSEGFEPESMALVMPRLFIEEFGLLPLRIAASRLLYLAFEDRLDASAAFAIQKMTDLKVESGLMETADLRSARQRLLASEFVTATREAVRDSEQMIGRVAEILEERQPVGARLVRMQRMYWLRLWLETGSQSSVGTIPISVEDVADVLFRVGS